MARTYKHPVVISGGRYDLRAAFNQQPTKSQISHSNSFKEMNSANKLHKLGTRFFSVEPPNENTTQQLLDYSLRIYFMD